jgi:hypothetical protein
MRSDGLDPIPLGKGRLPRAAHYHVFHSTKGRGKAMSKHRERLCSDFKLFCEEKMNMNESGIDDPKKYKKRLKKLLYEKPVVTPFRRFLARILDTPFQ